MKLFCKKTLLSSALLALGVSNIHAQSTNHNYVLTKESLVSTTDTAQLNGNPKFENISYFDDLGRPTVSITKPNTEKALATKVTYDGFGRTDKEYLPGVVTGINFPSTINYSNYPETDKVYSQKEYENSPLNRILKQGAPGEIWKVEGNNNIKFKYQTNTSNEVLNFGVSLDNNYVPTLVLNNYYSAGSLYKTITIDENGQPIQEFKDKEGKIILKRINIESKADFPKNSNGDHDTYYVYDIYGNLTYVLPPQLVNIAGNNLSDYINHLPELGYQYQYDEKNRLVEKQLPGKGREFMVYDKEDRLILYQDINMRNGSVNTTSENTTLNKGWTFTKYDKFGRILYTGYFKNTATRSAMQTAINSKRDANNETKNATGFTNNGLKIFYSNQAFPNGSLTVHTVNYYDNYEFLELKPSDLNEQSLVNELDQELKGISVATFSNILGTNTWNKNFTFFENKYLLPVITTQLNYNGGKTETKTEYDSFRGKVVSTTTTHQLSLDTEPVIVKERFKYNPDESIQYQTHQINDGPVEYIVRNEYNEIKQLVRKKIGNSSLNSPLEQVDYKFNIRGWLTDINSIENTSDRIFSFKIKYHDSERGDNLYNGNIGETLWKINNGATKSYAYHYDGLNRLLLGKSEVLNMLQTVNQYDERILGYDFNGNIKGLSRNTENNLLSSNGIEVIDELVYTYKENSNKLESINDRRDNPSGFNDYNKTGIDYEYDSNGNLIKDLNKQITKISYNHLNLPIEVLFNNDGILSKILYNYDASGVKVSKHVYNDLLIPYSENTFYDNRFQYKQVPGRNNNIALQFFPTAEGYVNVNEGIFEYVYNYTDHLGNVRVSYTKGEDGNRKIVDENSYYPFGLKHNNQSIVNTANPNYKYKYQGQERQDELGLNWDSFKWRNYDPAIGRFFNIDPLADRFSYQSPYNFQENKMGSGVELEGLELQLAPYLIESLTAAGAGGVILGTAHTQNAGAQVPDILTINLSEIIIVGTVSTATGLNNEFIQNSEKSIFGKIISGIASGLNAAWNILNNDSNNEADNKSTETTSGARTEPKDLEEQLSLEEAKSGAGDKIMEGKLKDPKYHPETGDTDKIGHTHDHGDGTKTEVHYDRNRQTGEGSGYKIKDDTNKKSRINLP